MCGWARLQCKDTAIGTSCWRIRLAQSRNAPHSSRAPHPLRSARMEEGGTNTLQNDQLLAPESLEKSPDSSEGEMELTLAQVGFPPPLTRPGARVEHILVQKTGMLISTISENLQLPEVRLATGLHCSSKETSESFAPTQASTCVPQCVLMC